MAHGASYRKYFGRKWCDAMKELLRSIVPSTPSDLHQRSQSLSSSHCPFTRWYVAPVAFASLLHSGSAQMQPRWPCAPDGASEAPPVEHHMRSSRAYRHCARQRPVAEHRPGAGLCQPRRATLQTAAASPRSLCRAARSSAWRACVSAVWRRPRDPLESAPTTRCLTVQPRFRAAHQAPSYSRTPRITGSQSL